MPRLHRHCGLLLAAACGRTDVFLEQTGETTHKTTSETGPTPTTTQPTGPEPTTQAPDSDAGTTIDPTTMDTAIDTTSTSAAVGVCGDGFVDPGEACDDGNADDSDECTVACALAICGDGVVQAGVEACDDGNADDSDECTSSCALAACGDGVVQVGIEVCDDGNVVARDGCDANCQPEGRPDVYLASALSDFGFHGYFIAQDLWVTLPSPPTISGSQLTNDGERVYSLGIDNTIYAYFPESQQWSADPIPGPGIELASIPTGFFKWTDQGFYYAQDGPTTLHHFKNGAWVTIALPNVASCAGTWVRADDELYVRSHQQTGFMVVRTLDDVVVRMATDITQVPEPSRMGAVSGGFFHVRGMFGPIERLDAITGEKSSTGQFPKSPQTAADTDPVTGSIYLAGYQNQAESFERYDPADNKLVTLADSPGVPDLSTITVMIPR